MIARPHSLIGQCRRRAFTLVESLAVIVVLAIAVPPAVSMMTDSAIAQADAIAIDRATWFATGILEQVMADASSDDAALGFAALADSAAYLNTPKDGLTSRIGGMVTHYNSLGLTHTVTIGQLADAAGTVTGDADEDVFRQITASVSWTTLSGKSRTLNLGCVVTDL